MSSEAEEADLPRRPIRRGRRKSAFVALTALTISGSTASPAQMATTYEYDVHGRLIEVDDAAGWTSGYQFDPASNRTSAKIINQFPQSWLATALQHLVGRADGGGWSARVTDPENYMVFGPDAAGVTVGNHVAAYRILVDNNTADNLPVAVIDVFDATSGVQLTSHWIARREWQTAHYYQVFELPFTLSSANAGHQIWFRVYYLRNAYVRVDKVGYR